ncbi:uncharacterized protein [Temnothorax nylanderi]|uniref:uncharacterized protein isoform X1 n=2 Tax=Temnothorax nylanderi TaxID=102681 RepID=UPI003A841079
MHMEEICGKQPGTTLYVYDDYSYNKDSRNQNILRCSTRRSSKCPGAINLENDQIRLVHDHNHTKTQWKIVQSTMKQEMLKLCRETSLSLKDIFDNVCRQYPDAAINLSYASLKSTLYRERRKLRPNVTKDMNVLAMSLSAYAPLEGFYKGSVTCSNGKTALIFTSNELLQELQKSTELYVDGTFNIVPRVPLMSQLYTIHTRFVNVGIGMIFVLCESRSSNLYTAIWEKIIELVPTLQQNLKFIMSDYEAAAMKAINKQFPTAEAHGCWFHFNQALLRHWRRLGLMDAPRNVLSMTMTMALIPSDCFEKAFFLIQLEACQILGKYPAVNNFLAYVRNTWLPLASKVSVHNCPVRTNNITESFHNIAGKKFGKSHGNVWDFLDNLRKLIVDEELKLKRLQTGEISGYRTSLKNKKRDSKILEAQRAFAAGRLDLEYFLRMFTDSCENFILTDTVVPKEGINHESNSISDEEDTPEKTRSETLYDNAESDIQVDAPFHKNTNKLLSANKEGINHESNSISDEEDTPEKTRSETLYDNAESDIQVDAPFHKNTNELLSANKEGNNQDQNLTSAEEGTPDSKILYDNAKSDIQVNAPIQKNTNKLLSANKEGHSDVHNSTSNKKDMPYRTRSRTLYNNVKSDIKVNAPFQKRTKKWLNANKENCYEENKNAQKQHTTSMKLRELHVVLHKIDEPLKKRYRSNRI